MLPGAFFLLAAFLNLYGRLADPVLASTVKPALMPLLALTALSAAGGLVSREIRLLVAALLFGCAGDTLLIFDGFLPFVGGMAAFLTGHVFYMILFGGKSWKGLTLKTWILSCIAMAAFTGALIVLIGVKGEMLVPMCVYGFALMLLIFSTLSGAVRFRSGAWWVALLGAVLFTFSDSLIAIGTFGGDFAGREFLVMLTYITAQSLLACAANAIGGASVISSCPKRGPIMT